MGEFIFKCEWMMWEESVVEDGERSGTHSGERHLSAITQLLQNASLELALPLAGIMGIVKSSN